MYAHHEIWTSMLRPSPVPHLQHQLPSHDVQMHHLLSAISSVSGQLAQSWRQERLMHAQHGLWTDPLLPSPVPHLLTSPLPHLQQQRPQMMLASAAYTLLPAPPSTNLPNPGESRWYMHIMKSGQVCSAPALSLTSSTSCLVMMCKCTTCSQLSAPSAANLPNPGENSR